MLAGLGTTTLTLDVFVRFDRAFRDGFVILERWSLSWGFLGRFVGCMEAGMVEEREREETEK